MSKLDLSKLSPEKRALLLKKLGKAKEEAKIQVQPRRGECPSFPLSFAQSRLWFINCYLPNSPTYNIISASRLQGPLNIPALCRTLTTIVDRHEILRTTYAEINEETRQIIGAKRFVDIPVTTVEPEEDLAPFIRLFVDRQAQTPFDLSSDLMIRPRLLRINELDHVLVIIFHHIASDGWSSQVFNQEFQELYLAYCEGKESQLPSLALQYADFSVWQREWMQGPRLSTQLEYWKDKLENFTELELPLDFLRPRQQQMTGARVALAITPEASSQLQSLSRSEGVSLFMTLMAAFKLLLYRYSGKPDIIVGAPFANRPNKELEPLIGFFINTLPLRDKFHGSNTFRQLIKTVSTTVSEAQSHQSLPFEKLIDQLSLERDPSRSPIYQVVFNFVNSGGESMLGPIKVTPLNGNTNTSKFDLTLDLYDTNQGLEGSFEFNTSLFTHETAARLANHLSGILNNISQHVDVSLDNFPLLSLAEKARLLDGVFGKDPEKLEVPFSNDSLIHQRFEYWADHTPNAVALTLDGVSLTYGELDKKANRLAHFLRQRGVGLEVNVGLCLNRSHNLIASILAVLKAGGIYVPIDPNYPDQRISFITEDADMCLLITEAEHRKRLPSKIVIVLDEAAVEHLEDTRPAFPVCNDNGAYIIYTSGSTGKPKGVRIPHRNVIRLFSATHHWFHFNEHDVWTLFHSYAFDFSVWEIWGAFFFGGRLLIVPYLTSRDTEAFYQLLVDERVTVLNQSPSAFRQLVHIESSLPAELVAQIQLRYVVFGAEALNIYELLPWFNNHGEEKPLLVNMYGITETCVHVTYRPVYRSDAKDSASPIGVGIPDLQLYLLDDYLRPIPMGPSGEIHVGGLGLASGYLKRPGLTAERFVPNPYASSPGGRLYRSGDKAQLSPNGELKFQGRLDHQVKIRGFRIELGEIQTILATHPAVRQVAVLAKPDSRGAATLVAYVIANGELPTIKELRDFLGDQLPEYMVPSYFGFLESFPMTAHGKLDSRALPEVEALRHDVIVAEDYDRPETEIEEALAAVWAEALDLERVGRNDNFFAVGGDSVLSIRVISLARKHNLHFQLQQLFTHQTIAQLARAIVAESDGENSVDEGPFSLVSPQVRAMLPQDVVDAYPMSRLQLGMIYHMEAEPDLLPYHNVDSNCLKGSLDKECFIQASKIWVSRHPIFRTSFHLSTYGEPLQVVHREASVPLFWQDLRGLSKEEQHQICWDYIQAERQHPFDTSKPTLLRFGVHILSENSYRFTLTEFHPILDGWSLNSALTELLSLSHTLQTGKELVPLPFSQASYRDYIRLELEAINSQEARDFWRTALGNLARREMPLWPKGGTRSLELMSYTFSAENVEALKHLGQRAGASLKAVLMAAHFKMCCMAMGSDDAISGVQMNGRPEIEGGDSVYGLHLNLIPIRGFMKPGTWIELIQEIFQLDLATLPYRRFPLATMQEWFGKMPLFNTAFNYIHFHSAKEILEESLLSEDGENYALEPTHYPYLTAFNLNPTNGVLNLYLQGTDEHFPVERQLLIQGYLIKIVRSMIAAAYQETPLTNHCYTSFVPEQETQAVRAMLSGSKEISGTDPSLVRTPTHRANAVALHYQGQELTYANFEARSGRLAGQLIRSGLVPGDLLGLAFDHPIERFCAMYGVLKAGCAFMPVWPGDAPHCLQALAPKMKRVIKAPHLELPAFPPMLLFKPGEEDIPFSPPIICEQHPAMAWYAPNLGASPAPIQFSRAALATQIAACNVHLTLTEDDHLLLPDTFDHAIWVVLMALQAGARISFVPISVFKDAIALGKVILARGINTVYLNGKQAENLSASSLPGSVRWLVCGTGDRDCPAAPKGALCFHGLTQLPLWVTVHHSVPDTSSAEAGGAVLSGSQVHVLDRYGMPAPMGAPGDLFLTGSTQADGIWQSPAATASQWVPNPYGPEGSRMLYSGLIARVLPCGLAWPQSFSCRQQLYLNDADWEKRLPYWVNQLAGIPLRPDLPSDHETPSADQGCLLRFATTSAEPIRQLGNGTKTPSAKQWLLTAFSILLHRISGQETFVVGLPFRNKDPFIHEGLRGGLLNILPFRIDLSSSSSFHQLAQQLQGLQEEAAANLHVPLGRLTEILTPQLTRPPFHLVFDFQAAGTHPCRLPWLQPDDGESASSPFDLVLLVREVADQYNFTFVFSKAVWVAQSMDRIVTRFQKILTQLTTAPDRALGDFPVLTQREQSLLLDTFNETGEVVPNLGFHQLFERQVTRVAQATALAHVTTLGAPPATLSYEQLNNRANHLARHMRQQGVRTDMLVGIFMEKGLDYLVAIYAILKAGAGYLPLDTNYPEKRIALMLEDAGLRLLITSSEMVDKLPQTQAKILMIEQFSSQSNSENPNYPYDPDQLAYAIYTSGSTGKPKGVMMSHRGQGNLYHITNALFKPVQGDNVLQFASTSFDAAVIEIHMALSSGVTLFLANKTLLLPGEDLKAFLIQYEITMLVLFPTAIALLKPADFPKLRVLLSAGEAPAPGLLASWAKNRIVINGYGPTEATVAVTLGLCRPEDHFSCLGGPLPNKRFYVLDRHMHPVPPGVPGELFVSSPGLARGYHERAALTAERFTPNPFTRDDVGGRLYRSGDLVRYQANAQSNKLHFMGRIDHQVKLRGFRIELGEIIAWITRFPGVSEALLSLTGDGGLTAYPLIEESAKDHFSLAALQSYLTANMPAFMVPTSIVVMTSYPLLPNGKINKNALPQPNVANVVDEGPGNDLEEILTRIWAEMLNLDKVGIHADFFALGGHSLLATRLVSKVRELLNIEVPLRALFDHPTPKALAQMLQTSISGHQKPPLQPVDRHSQILFPLSFTQERLWFLDRLNPGSDAYNMPMATRIRGALDIESLKKSFTTLFERHETLRTHFDGRTGEPTQVIGSWLPEIAILDLTHLEEQAREQAALTWIRRESKTAFDIEKGPLIRISLLQLAADHHILQITMHHIISDGWSMQVLSREFFTLYRAFSQGEGCFLPPLPVQYVDYSIWQRGWLSGETLKLELDWWAQRLAGIPPSLELPCDFPRPKSQTTSGAQVYVTVAQNVCAALEQLGQKNGATLYMTLLAAYAMLLGRLSGSDSFCVGTPVANRNHSDVEGMIGFFVNTLALPMNLAGSPRARDLIGRIRETVLSAFAHQELPFDRVVERIQPERDLSRSAIFQVMFSFNNFDIGDESEPTSVLPGLSFAPVETGAAPSKFDMTLNIGEKDGSLAAVFTYNTELFQRQTISRFGGYLVNLLTQLAENPYQTIDRFSLISESERTSILQTWGQNRQPDVYVPDLYACFQAAAVKHGKRTALVFGQSSFSFDTLLQASEGLANHLYEKGVRAADIVVLRLDPSDHAIVALLAILRLGAAWLPVDTKFPDDRLHFICVDAGANFLISQGMPALSQMTIIAPESRSTVSAPLAPVASNQLAYLIYTSGSTGQPKGVAISHGSATNLCAGLQEKIYGTKQGLKVTINAPLFFDGSVKQILTLLMGHTLYPVDRDLRLDADGMVNFLAVQDIDVLDCTPSHLEALLEAELLAKTSLSMVLVGGEAIRPALWDSLCAAPNTQFFNVYGPTECTVDVLGRAITDKGSKPDLGTAFSNSRIYILSPRLEPVPVSVVGQIYVAGAGLAQGYHKRPALTAATFGPNPFALVAGERLYRTGDLAHYKENGFVAYLSRIDHQVKIRGYRIELGEIEAQLLACEGVNRAVVLALAGQLVAWFVPVKNMNLDPVQLRRKLQKVLPDYMVPASLIAIEEVPLTANGKLDRAALPQHQTGFTQNYLAPRNHVERALAEIWTSLLGVERVGIQDHFFQLGGHSLLATRVLIRIRQILHVSLPLKTLFEEPILADLAATIEKVGASGNDMVDVPLVPKHLQSAPLSYSQARIWFLDRLAPGSNVYNVPIALDLVGDLDREALITALNQVIGRHQILSTTFADGFEVDGVEEPEQHVNPACLNYIFHDLIDREPLVAQSEGQLMAAAFALLPFDLQKGPLMRVQLIRLQEQHHFLVISMHHIITDGWSNDVLIREIAEVYNAVQEGRPPVLPELPVQYADYAVWQRNWLAGEVMNQQLAYWRKQLANTPVLELPSDRARQSLQAMVEGTQSFSLDDQTIEALRRLTSECNVTWYMLLLAAFQALLHRYSGQDDITVGAVIANRTRPEVERLIGFFVNTLVMRADLSGQPDFRSFLTRMRQTCLDAFSHQDVPFEKLVEEINPDRSLKHSPLFQVMFDAAVITAGQEQPRLQGLAVSSLESEQQTAKFELSMSMVVRADRIEGFLSYDTGLFDETTIKGMLGHFNRLLSGMAHAPHLPIASHSLLTAEEQHQMVVVWNQTAQDYDLSKPIHRCFEDRVAAVPHHIALECGDQQLSYYQLNERANQLAHFLLARGLAQETAVSICLDRSMDTLVAFIGVLKAGGCYVPLGTQSPTERMRLIAHDTGSQWLLTSRDQMTDDPGLAKTWFLDADWPQISQYPGNNPTHDVSEAQLAYIIFTSGSTGGPKGVAIPHSNIVNLCHSQRTRFALQQKQKFLLFGTTTFDAAMLCVYPTLLFGSTLVISPDRYGIASEDFVGLLDKHEVTAASISTAFWHHWAQDMYDRKLPFPKTLRYLDLGGEKVNPAIYQLWHQMANGKVRWFDSYGPTEITVIATEFEQKADAPIKAGNTIGWPVATYRCHILDAYNQPLPVGVAGELHVAGPGLARGYFKRAGLTAAAFVPNPYSHLPGDRLYKTGDLCRYQAEGNICFMGRNDFQVKIRGYRVELGEIEAALVALDNVVNVIVRAEPSQGESKELIAYVIPQQVPDEPAKARSLAAELRAAIASFIPDYMLPAGFVFQPEFPINLQGKIDFRKLSSCTPVRPTTESDNSNPALPRDVLEMTLMQIWEELLQQTGIGIHQDFFNLGGHSLLTVRLTSRIKQEFGVKIPLAELFETSTIASLAARIRHGNPKTATVPVAIRSKGKQQPIFLVHPVGGNILCYAQLAQVLKDRPIFAFEASGLDGEAALELSVTAMAASYCKHLLAVKPKGPYFLGGWSMGGIVAQEMAVLLKEEGKEVYLFLIDSWVPQSQAGDGPMDSLSEILSFATDLGDLFGISLQNAIEDLKELDPSQHMDYILMQAGTLGALPPLSEEQLRAYFRVYQNNLRVFQRHQPRAFEGPSHLFQAVERRHKNTAADGWRGILSQLTVSDAAGNHYSCLSATCLSSWSTILEDFLNGK